MLAALVDTDALLRVALFSVVGAGGLVVAFGLALVAVDRIEQRPAARAPWLALLAVTGLACAAIVVAGLWAMTQK